jgi:hypothetical protein
MTPEHVLERVPVPVPPPGFTCRVTDEKLLLKMSPLESSTAISG